ncbi:GntR family transcriptional regulator [Terribacillus saccharophilus]|uniref:GntR family transcriptional regulator n=1 Tax=Terribacillus saccharophilus TaxID=361277 RepID=UPI002DD27921|nr:GntR family transcriptional regulator [Terribacillus saccharophilus]MEC0289067.1 GntR family transcriptional regulator [Terribacillus saccharophilus]
MIDKNSPIPLYFQLEQAIRERIESGSLPSGEMLPPERHYTESLGISRMTVRHAMQALIEDGLLERRKNKGLFVKVRPYHQSLSKLTSFSEDMQARGLSSSSSILEWKEIKLSSMTADKLHKEIGAAAIRIKRLRSADQEPIAVETITSPLEMAKDLTENKLKESFYAYLESEMGLTLHRAEQEIEADLADEELAGLLNVTPGDAVLRIHRLSYLQDGRPFEYVTSTYRADKYTFTSSFYR